MTATERLKEHAAAEAAKTAPTMTNDQALAEYWRVVDLDARGKIHGELDTEGVDCDELATALTVLGKEIVNLEADVQLLRRVREAAVADLDALKAEAQKAFDAMGEAKKVEMGAEAVAHKAYCEASRLETIARNRYNQALRDRKDFNVGFDHLRRQQCPADLLPKGVA